MIQTKYGEFDGNKWEAVCQVCFKLKYEKDSYQEIKATPGDHGIEGFTQKGDAFQCYCPEKNYTQDVLHEKLRDKITEDLKKLIEFQKQLSSKLNGTKIKRWILVTPSYNKNIIIDHCAKKAREYRLNNLDILDHNFEVLIYDADFFAEHLPVALNSVGEKLFIESEEKTKEDIATFKSSGSFQALNIIKKSIAIIENKPSQAESSQSNKLAQTYIRQYLKGFPIINTLSKRFGKTYERYLRVVDEMSEQLDQKQIFHESTNKDFVQNILKDVTSMVDSEFKELDRTTKNRITSYIVAKWLADCPMRFDES